MLKEMADAVLGLIFIPRADIGPDPDGDRANVGDTFGYDSQAIGKNSLAIPRVLGRLWQGVNGASRLLHESCRVVVTSIFRVTEKAAKNISISAGRVKESNCERAGRFVAFLDDFPYCRSC
jgi:hypothetical protein